MSLNPFDNPEAVAQVKLGGSLLPGSVQSIAGAHRGFKWDVQNGTSSSGATNVFKGAQIAESIEIKTRVVDAAGWNACVAYRAYVVPPKIGGKPPTFAIDNLLIGYNQIGRVTIADVMQPEPGPGLSWDFTFKLTEYNPTVAAAAGKADPAKPGAAGAKGPSPVDEAEKVIADLAAQIKKI